MTTSAPSNPDQEIGYYSTMSATTLRPSTATQDVSIESKDLNTTSSAPTYPPFSKTLIIMAGVMVIQLLVALDRMIVGVAIPQITDEFHSLGDVGWYGSSFLLTSCAFGLFMGRVYTFYNPKWIYLGSLLVFEIGSAICGAAPNSIALIVGRAIAGLGNAGLFQGAVVIVVHIIPLHKRPQYMGVIGSMLGIASVAGPLLGGAFTDGPGWRWCFYINLPLGGVVIVLLTFFLHLDSETTEATTLKDKIHQLDPIGTFFFLPSIICLLLALQWGGVNYSWSNGRIIALLVVFAVLFAVFLFVQRWKGDTATVPGRIFFNRSIIAATWFNFFHGGAMMVMIYFLPVWFQAIKGASAVESGIMNLPMLLGTVIASVAAGVLTKKTGYYTQWMIMYSILAPIGAGLISTFNINTNHSMWIGYQALFGLGLGLGMMQASVAAQTVLPRRDVSTGASIMMFSMLLGGTVFISVGNNLFDRYLSQGLAGIQGLDVGAVVKTGATELRNIVSSEQLPDVLLAYNAALRTTFYLATALCCMTLFGSLATEWKSVKEEQQTSSKEEPNGLKLEKNEQDAANRV